eukprot:7265899-Prymnesium_polylepis.1
MGHRAFLRAGCIIKFSPKNPIRSVLDEWQHAILIAPAMAAAASGRLDATAARHGAAAAALRALLDA